MIVAVRRPTAGHENRKRWSRSMEADIPENKQVRIPYSLAQATALSWRLIVILVAAAAVVYALVVLRLLFIPTIIAILIATLLYPPTSWLTRKGWPRLLATWVVLLLAIGAIAGLIFLLAPEVSSQVAAMGEDLQAGSEDVLAWLAEGPLEISRQEINSYVDQISERLQQNAGTISSGVLSGAVKVIEIVTATLLAIVLTFFFVKDGEKIWGWVVDKFSGSTRTDMENIGTIAWRTLSSYVRGTAIVAFVDAFLIGGALFILGVPLALPLTLITFFGGFFPLVGATVAGIIATLVALATSGVADALIVGAWVIVVQQVEGDVLQPVVMGRAVRLHPVVILLALTGGALLGGVAGAFLAVPTVAVGAAVGNYMRTKDQPAEAKASA
jgi:putative heme transporter